MTRFILPALLVAFCASATVADEKPDLKKYLSGTWAVTSLAIIYEDKSRDFGAVTWTFEGDEVVVREGGKETARWGYSLTSGRDFSLIDFTVMRAGGACRLLVGVLDPEADRLTLVMRSVSATERETPPFLRPTLAESIGRKRSIVMTFARKK